jgi:hypothetical protein
VVQHKPQQEAANDLSKAEVHHGRHGEHELLVGVFLLDGVGDERDHHASVESHCDASPQYLGQDPPHLLRVHHQRQHLLNLNEGICLYLLGLIDLYALVV